MDLLAQSVGNVNVHQDNGWLELETIIDKGHDLLINLSTGLFLQSKYPKGFITTMLLQVIHDDLESVDLLLQGVDSLVLHSKLLSKGGVHYSQLVDGLSQGSEEGLQTDWSLVLTESSSRASILDKLNDERSRDFQLDIQRVNWSLLAVSSTWVSLN